MLKTSPGIGNLRQPLPNLSDRLILAPQTTAYLTVTQLWILREGLGDSLIAKLPGWSCNHSLAKFFPGNSGVDAICATPKGEGEIVLQKPLPRLWTTFLGVH